MGVAKRVNPKLLNVAESMERSQSPNGTVIDFTEAQNRGVDPGIRDIAVQEWPGIFAEHFPFYGLLNQPEQKQFMDACEYVYNSKNFVFQFGFDDDKGLAKLLISASTARLLLKRSTDLLQEFNTYIVYPGMFVNSGPDGALGMATYWDRKATRNQVSGFFQTVKAAAKNSAASLNFIFDELAQNQRTPAQKTKISAVAAAALKIKGPYPAPDAPDAALLAAIPNFLEFDRCLLEAFAEGQAYVSNQVSKDIRVMIASSFHKQPEDITSREFTQWYQGIMDGMQRRVKMWEHAANILKAPPKVSSLVHLPYEAFRASINVPTGMPDVCAHELGHCIDLLDGRMDGLTPDAADLPPDWPKRWAKFLDEESKNFQATYMGETEQNLQRAEFFAEACAAFFRYPDKMKDQDPDLYQLMSEFFKYDPPQVGSRWWNYVKTSFGLAS